MPPDADDTWIRALLTAIEANHRDHREDDRIAHEKLHKAIDGLRIQIEDLVEAMIVVKAFGRVTRWIFYIAASAGAVTACIKAGIGWIEK